MKTLTALIGITTPAAAFSAANAPAGDDGFFIWIFLGFFALIVVGQLVPAAMLIVGLVKGITANKKVKSEER